MIDFSGYKYIFLVWLLLLIGMVIFIYLHFRPHVFGTSPPRRHFVAGVHEVLLPKVASIRPHSLNLISILVEKSIADGNYPGAVILAGHQGHIIYQGIFGNRRVLPTMAPMRLDTLFDLASLTKVIATTPAVMLLLEQGKLELDAPVARYWPAFAQGGKEAVTLRELLTHLSGLPAQLPHSLQPLNLIIYPGHSKAAVLHKIETLKLIHPPGTHVVYSDINFIILAYLVEIITGERFEDYVLKHIFKPLGMNNTFFLPPVNLLDKIAPTENLNHHLRWGQVHDPTAYAMGGVAGHAGLFSDAEDLGIYAQWLLDRGLIPHSTPPSYLLGPLTILKMTTSQVPLGITEVRGLGWDIDSTFSCRGVLLPTASFGHTGWTGTSIWIDPITQTWVIILTSRTHPTPAKPNPLLHDRSAIADLVAASLIDISPSQLSTTSQGELIRAYGIKH
jgi:CubicO group peptidase (beta-lactamase class C family)